MDINIPVTNPRLKAFLHQLNVEQTDEAQNRALEEVALNAQFLAVIICPSLPMESDSGVLTLKETTKLQFPMLTPVDNEVFYPVFTDWDELRRWNQEENTKTLILTFDDYANMVMNNEHTAGIVINPFGESLLLERKLLAHMKTHKDSLTKGVSEQRLEAGSSVMLVEPKDYPTPMVNAISRYLKTNKTVRAAWLCLMINEDEQSFLLVLDVQGETERRVFTDISAVAKPHLHDMCLDMIPFETDFGQKAVSKIAPFYQRKKGFFGLR